MWAYNYPSVPERYHRRCTKACVDVDKHGDYIVIAVLQKFRIKLIARGSVRSEEICDNECVEKVLI